MTTTTTDRNHPGIDKKQNNGQNEAYLVLSEEEREKGFVRPVRRTYVHDSCGRATTMSTDLAETYARDPSFYSSTYCTGCQEHLPVEQFQWDDNTVVGS